MARIIQTAEEATALAAEIAAHAGPVAVDTETSGLRLYVDDKIRGMSVFFGSTGAYIPVSHPDSVNLSPAALAPVHAALHGRELVMHNANFDRAALELGLAWDLDGRNIWDTMAVDWMLDENQDHRLKEGVGRRLFGDVALETQRELKQLMRGRTVADLYREMREGVAAGTKEKADVTRERARLAALASKKSWADLTAEDVAAYAVRDTELTLHVQGHQREVIREELGTDTDITPDLERERQVSDFTHSMIRRGIAVDQEMALAGLRDAEDRVSALQVGFEHVNFKSPRQVAELLYDTWGLPCTAETASGNRGTDKNVLDVLSYDPRVARLIEFRKVSKQVDAYYRPLTDAVGRDGRIHPAFTTFRTVTGRFSCSAPNLQTIPRETTAAAIRKVFVAAPGLCLTEYDLSQIELRIAAEMSQEESLLAAFDAGLDLYQVVADDLEISRQDGKRLLLSAQYGIGPKKLSVAMALGTGKPADYGRAKTILDDYWRQYPKLDRLMKGAQRVAQKNGYVALWKPGRFRRFRSPAEKFPRYYSALNALIQGGAAEMLKDILLVVDDILSESGDGQIVLTVHDSLVIEHVPGAERRIADVIREATAATSPYKIATPWDGKAWK